MPQPAIVMAACGHLDGFVRRNVEAIRRHTREPYDLILIDDNSPDGTGDFFDQTVGVGDRVIHNPDNCGLAYVRNQGLRIVTEMGADPIIQIDSDCEVREGWLDSAMDALRETPAWIVGMCGVNVTGAPEYGLVFQTDTPGGESARRRQPADYVLTCMWVARGDIVDRVGWFDDVFCNWSGEDADYGMRTWLAGGQCWQTFINAFHPGKGSTVSGVPKANWIYGAPGRPTPDPWRAKWCDPYWASQWPHSMAERCRTGQG